MSYYYKLILYIDINIIMKKNYILFYIFFCLLLFLLILQWGNFIIKNYIIFEKFQNRYSQYDIEQTNHTVNLPINTSYSCSNFCGPQSQCVKTREQCTSDIDCFGCQPIINSEKKQKQTYIRGNNEAGKLTFNQTPRYSSLTTDIGTQALIINSKYKKVPQPYFGINTWIKSFNFGLKNYKKQQDYLDNKENKLKFQSLFPSRPTTTGLFHIKEPLPSNDYL